jgi:hypothetical protein
MGQDSLASIATALASFNYLARELKENYPGGLLVIDEIDVGFHPHAIDRLIKSLKTHANKLSLQIIATTHSPRLIEAVHPEGGGNNNAPDKVVYLLDTKYPRLADDQSLAAILDDMSLRQDDSAPTRVRKPVLGVYFEDQEGLQLCEALIPAAKRGALGRKLGVQIKLIPLGVGGSNLIALPEKDPIFKDRVLIVDADTSIPKTAAARGNTIKFPCHKGASGTDRSPENMIKIFLRATASASEGPLREALLRFDVSNPTSDKVISTFFADSSSASSQRGASKGWWKAHWNKMQRWGVLREWIRHHSQEATDFVGAFEAAVTKTAQRITS